MSGHGRKPQNLISWPTMNSVVVLSRKDVRKDRFVGDELDAGLHDPIRVARAYVPGRVGTTGSIEIAHNARSFSTPCEVFRHGDGFNLRIYGREGSVEWDFDASEFLKALESARRIAEESDSPP